MDPWDNGKPASTGRDQRGKDASLHVLLLSHKSPSPEPSSTNTKRVIYPAVPFMTVKAERKCLSEIRNYTGESPENLVLSNGMRAEDFALMYVLGHQLKRKEKQTTPTGR